MGNQFEQDINQVEQQLETVTVPTISGGRIFFANNKTLLEGVERGIDYANDGALSSKGIYSSDREHYAYMLIIEDSDEDEVLEEVL